MERKRKRAQWNTPEKTEPARQDGLAGEERGSEREGENVRTTEKGGAGGAAGTQLMSPQSLCLPPLVGGQRSGRPPPPSPPRSPSLFLALPSCYVMKLEEE